MLLTRLQFVQFGQYFVLLTLCALTLSCSTSDNKELSSRDAPGFFTTIYRDTPLSTTLSFDLDSLVYYKDGDEEVDGIFTINFEEPLTVDVELRARGVFRKNLCPFPPIRLQIKKSEINDHDWGPHRNYKLVTHCFDTTTTDEILLREYLTYKMYEELSDLSMRAQLLQMQYIVRGDTLKHFAILVENESEMSDRLGLEEMDIETTKLQTIHLEHYKRFVLFQYMVGNTDWNLKLGHNTKFVLESESQTPIIIPYDFDCSGLVNAPYAKPYPTMPISHVRERYFMYRGKKDDDFSSIITEFLEKKSALYSLVNDMPYLSDHAKKDLIDYIGEFYEIIEEPDWKEHLFPS